MLLGSDDTHRIWLNGQLVHQDSTPSSTVRETIRDQNAVLVTLEAGWNTVVARVDNVTGEFALYLRLSNDLYELASVFERSGEWHAALEQLGIALQANPNSIGLRFRSAQAANPYRSSPNVRRPPT